MLVVFQGSPPLLPRRILVWSQHEKDGVDAKRLGDFADVFEAYVCALLLDAPYVGAMQAALLAKLLLGQPCLLAVASQVIGDGFVDSHDASLPRKGFVRIK